MKASRPDHDPEHRRHRPRYQSRHLRMQQSGTSIAELAGILLVFFIFLAFPLMNLCTLGLRSSLLMNSAREASISASKSLTYSATPVGAVGNTTPAIQTANVTVKNYLSHFSGVNVSAVRVGILTVSNASGNRQGPVYKPLSSVDQQFGNTYYLDVAVDGEAEPLITYRGGMLGPIPGLTSPIKLSAHGQRVFENPRGLTM